MNDSVLHKLFCALKSADRVYNNYALYQFLHATQPGTSISNFELILQTDADAKLIQCLSFYLGVLYYCIVPIVLTSASGK